MKDMRPDRSPRELRDLLHGVVPGGPDPAGRADGVVRRAKRASRRRGTASAAAVALVALTVIVGPHLLPGSPVSNGATGVGIDTSAAAARLADPFTCPTPGQPAPVISNPATDEVPAGAVLARICPAPDTAAYWVAPHDALTTNVGGLSALYNGLRIPNGELVCTLEANMYDFNVTFQYPDGRLVRLNGVTSGCGLVSLQGPPAHTRLGGAKILSAYFNALREQRSARTPPDADAAVSCPVPTKNGDFVGAMIPGGAHLDLSHAVICEYSSSPSLPLLRAPALHFGTLSAEQVQAVDADYEARAATRATHASCSTPANRRRILVVGSTPWGDRVDLTFQCGRFYALSAPPVVFWTPSAPVMRMLNSLLEQ